MTWPIELVGVDGSVVSYKEGEAKAALAGYAFGQVRLEWTRPRGLPSAAELAVPPWSTMRYRWGYRSYDCVPASPNCVSVEDIVITAALDANPSGKAVLGLEAITPDLNETLARIPMTTTFWQLPVDDLGDRPPAPESESWWIWRSWSLLMALPDVERAITHKLLHRIRPWLFPMLDSVTSSHLGGLNAWSAIRQDLGRHEQEFIALERWFATLASAHDGVQLTRLRIHDILLWGDLSGSRREMQLLGRQFLGLA